MYILSNNILILYIDDKGSQILCVTDSEAGLGSLDLIQAYLKCTNCQLMEAHVYKKLASKPSPMHTMPEWSALFLLGSHLLAMQLHVPSSNNLPSNSQMTRLVYTLFSEQLKINGSKYTTSLCYDHVGLTSFSVCYKPRVTKQ